MLAILREAWRSFAKHDGRLLAAALAFYAILASAPLLVFGLAIASRVLGGDAVREEVARELTTQLGPAAAQFVADTVERTAQPAASWAATTVGAIFLIYATLRLFIKLQSALNTIWGVRIVMKSGWVWPILRKRILAMTMVFVFGAWLLLILSARAALSVLSAQLGGENIPHLWHVAELCTAAIVHASVVWLLFKALPDVWIGWKDVLVGAVVTAALLTVGTELIGVYLGRIAHTSAYGAAGALILLLLWLYYVFQILMFGAEVTGAFARAKGHGVRPHPHTIRVLEHAAPL